MSKWPDDQFDAFVADRMTALVAFAFGLCGDLGLSQDLVQTALMKVYLRSRHRMPDSPEAYVRRSIANEFVSGRRRRRVPEDLVAMAPEPPPAQSSDARVEQVEAVNSLLAGLSPRQRAVLVLRYREDWSEAQIAEGLGISTGTVKTLASRGLAALRESLSNREVRPS